jgi:hypothetical protein
MVTNRLEIAQRRLMAVDAPPLPESFRLTPEQIAALPAHMRASVQSIQDDWADGWAHKVEREAPRMPWYGPKGRWLTVYHVQLAYGGPEEGGWWYHAGERVECANVRGRDAAEYREWLRLKWEMFDDSRGLSPSDSIGMIVIVGPDSYQGSDHYPDCRPHYE